jgi:cellulose synthase/poly-beta-1,6-N-acetylglucosamine synthase-like glycosyltransferase
MVILFYLLVVQQIAQGLYSLWQGFGWLQAARKRLARPTGFFAPRVAVFCPVKGLEPGLEENLAALTELDYPEFEVFLAVSGVEDPAYRLLERVAALSKHPVHIVRAGRAKDCGDKVNNLRAAVDQAGDKFDVFVFTDSDGRPSRRWLARLVAPLADTRLGAATTFRWLIPLRGGLWSALASAWNASIATYLGEHDNNFCWGGGTAIRRLRFEEIRAAEFWRGSVSDDYSLTNALRHAGYKIEFVPECLVPSLGDLDLHGLLEFTTRQLIITRVYAPRLWKIAALGHVFYCAALLLGLALWVGSFFSGRPGIHFLILILLLLGLAAVRGMLRLAAVLDLLPEWRETLLAYAWAWTLLAPIVPFVYAYNATVAAFSRRIRWRGIRYELVSPRQTHIISG